MHGGFDPLVASGEKQEPDGRLWRQHLHASEKWSCLRLHPPLIQRGVMRGRLNSAALSVKDQRWKLNESDSSIESSAIFHNPGRLHVIGPDLWPPPRPLPPPPHLFNVSHLPRSNIAPWLRQIWFGATAQIILCASLPLLLSLANPLCNHLSFCPVH